MKFSKNSWHARLYNLTYSTVLPENLCPYFWKVVIAMVLFLPLAIFFIPYKCLLIIQSWGEKHKEHISDEGFLSDQIGIAFALNCGLFFLTGMIGMWFQHWGNKIKVLQFVGVLGWFIAIVCGIAWLSQIIKEKREEKYYQQPKEDKPNIFVEFVKAKYSRYCPKINWDEKAE